MKREIKIGLFAVAMLLCLYIGVNYLKGRDVFSSDRTYFTLLEHTGGLQKSSAVTLKGVKIGSVSNIGIDSERADNVVVTVSIKRRFRIPVDSRFVLNSGFLTSSSLELVPGTATGYFERNAVIPSEASADLLAAASMSLNDVMTEFKRVVNSLDATANTINKMLEANAESIEGTMHNINMATRELAEARIGAMLRDVRAFTSVLKDNSKRFDNIMGNVDELTGSLAEADIKGTVDGLNTSIDHLNGVLGRLSEGDGTLGRLIDDPALYDSLTSATTNLAALLGDLKENPRRYVHFSLFGGGRRNN